VSVDTSPPADRSLDPVLFQARFWPLIVDGSVTVTWSPVTATAPGTASSVGR
jgi:hypothetical protein